MRWRMLIFLSAALLPTTATADGQKPPMVTLELNKLEADDGACGAFLVARNATDERIERLNLDLVIFDKKDVIARRLAVEMGPLNANKTVVRGFAMDGLSCEAVGALLLNDVIACEGSAAKIEDCLEQIKTSSRSEAPFFK